MNVHATLCLFSLACLLVLQDASGASTKKGIAGWPKTASCDEYQVLNNMSWYYDWHLTLDDYKDRLAELNCPDSIQDLPEFVPMLWSYYPGKTVINIDPDAQFVLGFNEPDKAKQANLTPEEAAAAWRELEEKSQGLPLVSPVTASSKFDWLDQFFGNCTGCRVDFIGAHSYRCGADGTMNYLQRLYDHFGRKVWLTEFACKWDTSEERQIKLMKDLLPRLEAADFVYRYAWFMVRILEDKSGGFVSTAASLFKGNTSELTQVGQFYNDFQP